MWLPPTGRESDSHHPHQYKLLMLYEYKQIMRRGDIGPHGGEIYHGPIVEKTEKGWITRWNEYGRNVHFPSNRRGHKNREFRRAATDSEIFAEKCRRIIVKARRKAEYDEICWI